MSSLPPLSDQVKNIHNLMAYYMYETGAIHAPGSRSALDESSSANSALRRSRVDHMLEGHSEARK
jgi:hypothetical protein